VAGSFVTIATEFGCRLTVDFVTVPAAPPDPDYLRPHGVLGFTLRNCDHTPALDIVTLSYHGWTDPSAAELAAGMYRAPVPWNVSGWSEGPWYGIPYANFLASDPDGAGPASPVLAVRFFVVDGGYGDDTYGVEDGEIVHVGAVALPAAFVANAAPIPTISHVGRALLGLLLFVAARARFSRSASK
jgi:hypothetical protein